MILLVIPPEHVTTKTFKKLYLKTTTAVGTPSFTKKKTDVTKTEKIFKNSAIELKNTHFKPLMLILIDAKKGYIYILA